MPAKRKRKRKANTDADTDSDNTDSSATPPQPYILPSLNSTYTPYNDRLSEWSDRGRVGDTEHHETLADFNAKCKQLAQMIMQAENTVVFTGAGVSTACGISDFRGPTGVWTQQMHTRQQQQQKPPPPSQHNNTIMPIIPTVSTTQPPTTTTNVRLDQPITPSYTHMAISTLTRKHHVHNVVSQNIDCLHLRSGIPRNQLVEVHGNLYAEQCHNYKTCGIEYIRPYDLNGIGCRLTGRQCDNIECRQPLYDKTYDWHTDLANEEMKRAEQAFDKADLCIVLGTSLRVDPAGRWPLRLLKRGDQVAVVNLQNTYIDKKCTLRIYENCDTVMQKVMSLLRMKVDAYNSHMSQPPYLPRRNKYVNTKLKMFEEPDVPAYITAAAEAKEVAIRAQKLRGMVTSIDEMVQSFVADNSSSTAVKA